jgi:hypothetical protein
MDRSPSSMRIARTLGDVSGRFSLLLYPACGVRVGGRRMLFFFVPKLADWIWPRESDGLTTARSAKVSS